MCKQAAGLTTSILGGFGSGITSKLGQMRNSESFRSLEERVGSAYENVKVKYLLLFKGGYYINLIYFLD